jgi:hypothetical protein
MSIGQRSVITTSSYDTKCHGCGGHISFGDPIRYDYGEILCHFCDKTVPVPERLEPRLPTLGSDGCWCGKGNNHDWEGRSEGAPHPR